MNVAIIIPFRDRGTDPTRQANLDAVLTFWEDFGAPVHVVTDGRTGSAQFNRHAAYNRGIHAAGPRDAYLFTEADTLTPYQQVRDALALAVQAPGLVVPFTERHHLGEQDSQRVRDGAPAHAFTPDFTRGNRRNCGAVNALSHASLELVGRWDETFDGHWFDDDAMHIAFDITCGPTRWVDGPAYHLWHQSPSSGPHLTADDKRATARNKARLHLYRQARTPEQIRALTT